MTLGALDKLTVGKQAALRPTWRKGKLVALAVVATPADAKGVEYVSRTHDLIPKLAKLPAMVDVRALHVGRYDQYGSEPVKMIAALVKLLPKLPALKELSFGDEDTRDNPLGDITPLFDARLEALRITGRSFTVGALPSLALRELTIACKAMKDAALQAIAAATMPALERVDLDLGSYDTGDCCRPKDIMALLSRPTLRSIAVRTAFAKQIAKQLAKRKLDHLFVD